MKLILVRPEVLNQDFDNAYFASRLNDTANRKVMHSLDRRWVYQNLKGVYSGGKFTLLDIGCSDGSFSSEFQCKGAIVYGIEPNEFQASLAKEKGLRIVNSVNQLTKLDVVIIRGTLHHLPNWQETLNQILTVFKKCPDNFKFIFILAEPNKESWIYQRFNKLPALEDNTKFSSNYEIFGAKEFSNRFSSEGLEVKIRYPYFRTPYRRFGIDLLNVLRMIVTSKYIPTAWKKNMFNLVIRIPPEKAKFIN